MTAKHLQLEQIMAWDSIVTVEDHLADCGFGSWLRESLESAVNMLSRISVLAIDRRVCGMVGDQKTLNSLGGLPICDL